MSDLFEMNIYKTLRVIERELGWARQAYTIHIYDRPSFGADRKARHDEEGKTMEKKCKMLWEKREILLNQILESV